MTVAIRIAGIAHTPLATHPRVASPPTTARAPRAGGGGPYPATADAVVVPDPGSRFIRTRDAQRSRDSVILAPHFRVIMFPASYHVSRGSLVPGLVL